MMDSDSFDRMKISPNSLRSVSYTHLVAIDCIAVEDEYGSTPAQRAELDWLLYNKPLELSLIHI